MGGRGDIVDAMYVRVLHAVGRFFQDGMLHLIDVENAT